MSFWHGFVRQDKKDSLSQNMMHSYRHSSGFTVAVFPKPSFRRRYVSFIIPAGALMTRFQPGYDSAADAPEPPVVEVPAGTAHLVEHLVFARESGGGLFRRLAALGAEADAWTGLNETVFSFVMSEEANFLPALDLVWQAILNLDGSAVDLERELQVIHAEIDLYGEVPDTVAWRELSRSLFLRPGLREDILGSHRELARVGPQEIDAWYRSVYHPAWMSLVLVGDFNEPELGSLLRRLGASVTAARPWWAPRNLAADEPEDVLRAQSDLELDVENPFFVIGFKDPGVNACHPLCGADWLLRQMMGSLYLETVLGESSPLHQELSDGDVINDSFGAQYVCSRDHAYVILSGEAADPGQAAETVTCRLRERIRTDGIDVHRFSVQTKAAAGDFLRSLDTVESFGSMATMARLSHMDLFDYASVFNRVSPQQAESAMAFLLDEAKRSTVRVTRRSKRGACS
ncbi:MAG: pitrilysin family protein [Bacillota bacterium]|nr:pitrilysin family protein [Bacillota bacterium]